jgi:antirestriction protein ArdC
MSYSDQEQRSASRPGLYQEITDRIIQQIEAGIIPWVQPWASNTSLSVCAQGPLGMPSGHSRRGLRNWWSTARDGL